MKKIFSQTQTLSLSLYNTHLSSMQHHHHLAANTTSRRREFKNAGEHDGACDSNAEQSDMGSRRRPCLGDNKSEAPPDPQKKPQKICSEKKEKGCHRELNGGGETGVQGCSPAADTAAAAEDTGRERLKRLRVEVAGRVWIPENWGQEDLLKDWIDCCGFDASLMNSNVMSAREALMAEGRRATSSRLRIENSC